MPNTEFELLTYNKNIFINGAALVVILAMAIWAATNKHKVREMKMFIRMCVLTAGIAVADVVYYMEIIRIDGGDASTLINIAWLLIDVCGFLLVGQWLLFVEYSLHQSNDVIKRDYKYIMIPFWIAVALIVSNYLFYNDFFFNLAPNKEAFGLIGGVITRVFQAVAKDVMAFYYIFAFYLVIKEKKRIKIPNYVVISPTVICFVVGMYYDKDYMHRVQSIFFTLGLFLIWFFMFRRFDYMDPETGFFTEKYIKVLSKYYSKSAERGCTVIRFITKGDIKKTADIIKEWVPDDARSLVLDGGRFLVVSESLDKAMVKQYMALIKAQAAEEGIELEADSAMRTDEPIEEFFAKLVEKQGY